MYTFRIINRFLVALSFSAILFAKSNDGVVIKDDIDSLNTENQLNYRLFTQLQQNSIDLIPFNQHLMPFSHRGGVQLMHEQSERLRFVTKRDFEDWIDRLSKKKQKYLQMPYLTQLEDRISLMKCLFNYIEQNNAFFHFRIFCQNQKKLLKNLQPQTIYV